MFLRIKLIICGIFFGGILVGSGIIFVWLGIGGIFVFMVIEIEGIIGGILVFG